MRYRMNTVGYARQNPDRVRVTRATTMDIWVVWRGYDELGTRATHESAINFATEEARFEHFWRDWYSKTSNATREKARNYWDFFMTKGERNAW